MSSFTVLASLLLITVVLLHGTPSVVASPSGVAPLDGGGKYTDVVSDDGVDKTRAVTPYGYKAVMLQNVPGRKVLCWRCSSPCSAYMCCDDGYPQCCLVGGSCRCCRV